MKLEKLKELALKFEEIRYKSSRGKQVSCVIVLHPELKQEMQSELVALKSILMKDKELIEVPLHYMELKNVTRVSLSRKKSYRAMKKKLSDPHPDAVNAANANLKKAKEGKSPGMSIELLKKRVSDAETNTISRRAEIAASKLPELERQAFLKQLKKSKECIITNYHEVQENLWMTIQSEGRSLRKRALNGVTVIFSSEDHSRTDGQLAKVVDAALEKNWVAGNIVLIK